MRRGLRRLASENVVRAGVLDADSSVIAGTEAMSKSSKAPGGSSKTVCIESDFSEVGPGICLDSSGKEYYSIASFNKLASRDLAEYCIVLGTTLFARTPGFVGVEVNSQTQGSRSCCWIGGTRIRLSIPKVHPLRPSQ